MWYFTWAGPFGTIYDWEGKPMSFPDHAIRLNIQTINDNRTQTYNRCSGQVRMMRTWSTCASFPRSCPYFLLQNVQQSGFPASDRQAEQPWMSPPVFYYTFSTPLLDFEERESKDDNDWFSCCTKLWINSFLSFPHCCSHHVLKDSGKRIYFSIWATRG